jgi:hypothetical protein
VLHWRELRWTDLCVRRYWRYHVSVKLPPLITDGAALTVLPEVFVIGSRPGVELVNSESFTLAPPNAASPKSASGRMPPLPDWASAIASAEPSFADFARCVVVCDHPRVASLNVA